MLDSYFYPGFFDAQAKLDVARGPLAYIIKNYIARCNSVPKLIAYTKNVSAFPTCRAYFVNDEGMLIGMVEHEEGDDPKYTLSNAITSYGSISINNLGHYAASTKPNYIVSAITKERAGSKNPSQAAGLMSHWFPTVMSGLLYKHARRMRKEPEPPVMMTLDEMAHVTPVLLDGVSPVAVPANVRNKIERIHAYINKRSDSHLEWNTHATEMFKNEKWVVIPRKFHDGSRVYTVGAIQFDHESLTTWIKDTSSYSVGARAAKITQPFTTYRTLEDLPDDLLGMMTMQLHILKTTHNNFLSGTDNMVPYTGSTDSVVWPEMNSGVYDLAADTVAYILDK